MAKVKKKTKSKTDGLDWDGMKEEFFSDLNADGSYRYANVEEFGRHIARGNTEMYKRVVRSIRFKPYKGYEWRGDWASERLRASVKDDAQVKALSRKINAEFDMLEVGKDVAQTYVPLQGKVDRLFIELDEVYGGRPVLIAPPIPKPDPKRLKKMGMTEAEYIEDVKLRREQSATRRLKDYMRCLSQILKFKRAVDQQLLECLGWNRPQFLTLIKNLHKNGESTGVKETKVMQVMNQLAMMQLNKAKVYGLELPEDFAPAMKLIGNGHDKEHAEMVDEDDALVGAIPVNGNNGRRKNGKNGKH